MAIGQDNGTAIEQWNGHGQKWGIFNNRIGLVEEISKQLGVTGSPPKSTGESVLNVQPKEQSSGVTENKSSKFAKFNKSMNTVRETDKELGQLQNQKLDIQNQKIDLQNQKVELKKQKEELNEQYKIAVKNETKFLHERFEERQNLSHSQFLEYNRTNNGGVLVNEK